MLSLKIREFIKEQLAVVSDNNFNPCFLTEGRSGAEVYRVKVISRRDRLTGNYVVKVCGIPKREEKSEACKANILYRGAPDFSQHLVKVESEAEVDGKYVIIYHQANNSVIDMTSFSELSGEILAKYVKQVSFDLLACLNKDKKIEGTASDFFNCLLTKQIGESGRFESRVRNLIDNPEAESIALIGEIFPNPYYFIKNISKLEQCLQDQIFFKGMVHGDLHGYNMIASRDTYSLIDYDSVMEDSYLFFDQAYFEFSIFYDNSKDNDLKKWNTMLEILIKPSIFNKADVCEYYKEYRVRNAVCNGIIKWIENEHLEKMKDDIELQFIMARIAAGINFFCKKSCVERGKQLKVLYYIAYCCKILADKTGYQCDENDISVLRVPPEYTDAGAIWEGFVKFTNYVPVLITDDKYPEENCGEPENICAINWKLVIDVGLEQEDFKVYRYFLKNCKTRVVKRIDATSKEKTESFGNTLNVLAIRKSADKSYRSLWRDYKNTVTDALKKLISENPRVPLVFVFDCSVSAAAFKDKLINDLCDLKLPGATRIVSLRTMFSKDMKEEIPELEDKHKWYFVEHEGVNLVHVGLTCKTYLSQPDNVIERSANLPSINGVHTFSNKDLCSFEDCIELVYSGCERNSGNDVNCSGLDMSGGGDSLGEAFYKGNEATWNDIANNRDLMLIDNTKYMEISDKLSKLLNNTSPRVKTTTLLHGAGSGGTTLSKHILWSFKDQFPCARLKKYTSRTAEILTEIYRNTGKCILLSVESGSTVISDEELNRLKKAVDAENGRMVVLLIKRIENNLDGNKERNTALAFLGNTMPIPIAKKFYDVFSAIASKKEEGNERRKLLEKITGVDRYKEQRSPFFYGFYTFQEEYQLMESLSRTVSECSLKERILLNSLSLITIFSQNICVAFSELKSLLDKPNTGDTGNIYALLEGLSPAIFKLMTLRDKEGLRLCHRLIAEKILFLLHAPQMENPKIEDVTFKSAKMYIETMWELYDSDSEYVDKILKELIIDRAYIDSEERKTKFSLLVESIPLWTKKKELFDLLIEKFPKNPHYYNHLARLLAIGEKNSQNIVSHYEDAIKNAEMAIEMAVSDREMHETTLGCIYGQWIINTIDSEKENKKSGRMYSRYPELISEISVRYGLAKDQFDNAREDTDVYDSFSFFPQINMECAIISHLVAFDEDRDISQLIKEEPEFSEWYNDHFSVATELYIRMREQLGDDVRLLKEAKNKLSEIAQSNDEIDKHFTELLDSDSPADRRNRRSLAYTVFSLSGCSWGKVEEHTLQLMEECFRKNVMAHDTNHNNSDIGTWFELYRRVDYFQAFKAQSFIADYMDDGYRKEYLLFLMSFIMRKEGISSASAEVINRHIAEANRIARLSGLNTAKEHDVYVGGKNGKCPIVSLSDVNRDKAGEPEGLEEFTGIVTEVEQTYGKILLNGLNLEVIFVPKPQSAGKDPLRVFKREDVDCPVKLNIMFSYSGLRGWNVIKK